MMYPEKPKNEKKKKNEQVTTRHKWFLLLIFILMILFYLLVSEQGFIKDQKNSNQCVLKAGYQLVMHDGAKLLISNPQTGVLEPPSANIRNMIISDLDWSPTGEYVMVFGRDGKNPTNLNNDAYLLSADGSEFRNLTMGKYQFASSSYSRWTPDGKFILFVWKDAGEAPNLHFAIIDIATDTISEIATIPEKAMYGYAKQWAWSPDGTRLIYYNGDSVNPQLFMADVDGKNHRPFYSPATRVPLWSPDSTRLLLLEPNLTMLDATTGEVIPFTHSGISTASALTARWSNDSKRVALQIGNKIWIMDADGNNLQQLSQSGAVDYLEGWSPTGQYLVYMTHSHTDNLLDLRLVNIETGETRELGDESDFSIFWGWSANDEWFVYHQTFDSPDQLDSMIMVDTDGNELPPLLSKFSGIIQWTPDRRYFTVDANKRGLLLIESGQSDGCVINSTSNVFDWNPVR